jgi:eukaryotic-like serine/threonine-protein kinase
MSMLRLDDRLLGRFRIDARIAEGGMGVVYRGFDLKIDRPIAIKVLRPDAIENAARFEREATILATIDHPGVLRYVAHGVAHEGSPFLVAEWIEGITLADHLARVGLTLAESVAVVRRVALALGAAHARGLVHRDVKPENVLLAGGDLAHPKVIDFGLVKHASGDQRLTETGMVVGTPGYMAPEQARGEREVDARTDVFALGCVLYECLTGLPAFAGRNAAAVMARIVLCESPALRDAQPDLPAALEPVVHRMLAKRPDDRPADANVVAAELDGIALPDGPRVRRASQDSAATTIVPPERAAHVIFVRASEPGAASATVATGIAPSIATGIVPSIATGIAPSIATSIAPIVAPFGGRAHALRDGTIVVVLGEPDAQSTRVAQTAAACALALGDALPEAPIALVGPSDACAAVAPLASLIEAGADALEQADLQAIFGADATMRGAIRIDPTTAARLAADFEIHKDASAHYLIGRRRP